MIMVHTVNAQKCFQTETTGIFAIGFFFIKRSYFCFQVSIFLFSSCKINSLQYQALLRKRLDPNPYLDLGWIRLKPLRSETLLIIVLIKKRRTRDECCSCSVWPRWRFPVWRDCWAAAGRQSRPWQPTFFSSAVQLWRFLLSGCCRNV